MAKQYHWEYYYYGPEHPSPPPRFPWMRDAVLAAAVGALLGITIGLRIALGYWTAAILFFIPPVVIHTLVVSAEQIFKTTRRERTDLVRMLSLETTAVVVAAIGTWLIAA